MDNQGLAQLREEGAEDGQLMEIDWRTLKRPDIDAMREVVGMIAGWETEYNALFSNPAYSSEDDGRMDELSIELLTAYSIRETLQKIDAVNAITA